MAKDPAFLFYPNDWLGGTTGMNFEEKGAYMELLILQFNKGSFTADQAKKVLNGSFERLWPELKDKFSEADGKFFNERLETEKLRRKKFIEKQSENGKRGGRNNPNQSQTEAKPNPTLNPKHPFGLTNIENENENRNETVFEEGGMGEETFKNLKPGKEEMDLPLPEHTCGAVIQFFAIAKKQTTTNEDIEGLWAVFKAQNFTGKKWYPDVGAIYSHFINWCNTKKIENATSKKGTSETRIDKAANW